MTQNGTVNKTDTFDMPSTGRREFLNALYAGSPDNLYLELRCIHPTTGEARSLWGRMGNKSELVAALKRAEALNREGYEVYSRHACVRGSRAKRKPPRSFRHYGSILTVTTIPTSATSA